MSQQLPPALISSLESAPGFSKSEFINVHNSGEQVISIRLNRKKIEGPIQNKTGIDLLSFNDHVPWAVEGYYLESRPSFTTDPFFHAGLYYVQEASSMFVEEAVRQTVDLSGKLHVLDLCAAPGGKSTLLSALINEESLLVSNEVIKTRAAVLAENITKWGASNAVVTSNDPRDFRKLPGFFDLIVVDAPCSGSGLFRKDPGAVSEWSKNSVELCSQRQERILADVLPSLKEGGTLIYCTCSYSQEEDEAISDWILENEEHSMSPSKLEVPLEWNIVETVSDKGGYGYRFYPDKIRGEGFFLSAFKKLSASASNTDNSRKQKPLVASKAETAVLENYITDISIFNFIKMADEVIAIPSSVFPAVMLLRENLYIKKAGIKCGSLIRNELVPDHELVMSLIMKSKIARVEVDLRTALDYLRRKEIQLDHALQGWAIISYLGFSLGFVKILQNRINNYYPREWRIINK